LQLGPNPNETNPEDQPTNQESSILLDVIYIK